LAAGFGSLDAYLHNRQDSFGPSRPGMADPYDLFASMLQQMRLDLARYTLSLYSGYPYYGNFGGGFGGGGSMGITMDGRYGQQGYDKSGQLLPTDPSVYRSESLYAYPIGPTTLQPGDRLTKLLFEQHSHYKTIYRWNGFVDSAVEEFLRIHNDAKAPWTGGTVMIAKEGIPLAQTAMPFTATGHDADLPLGNAPDVLTDKDVQEIKAEPVPPTKPDYTVRRRITEETKMAVQNTKDEPITVEVVLTLPGDVVTTGAKIDKLPRKYTDINARSKMTWTLQLGPGEQKRIQVTNTFLR
jgi:hypothetical protein